MRDPRFHVRSISGYSMGRAQSGGARKPHTSWYVMDTAYCWEIVSSHTNQLEAEAAARALNKRYGGPRRGIPFAKWNAMRHRERVQQ